MYKLNDINEPCRFHPHVAMLVVPTMGLALMNVLPGFAGDRAFRIYELVNSEFCSGLTIQNSLANSFWLTVNSPQKFKTKGNILLESFGSRIFVLACQRKPLGDQRISFRSTEVHFPILSTKSQIFAESGFIGALCTRYSLLR